MITTFSLFHFCGSIDSSLLTDATGNSFSNQWTFTYGNWSFPVQLYRLLHRRNLAAYFVETFV